MISQPQYCFAIASPVGWWSVTTSDTHLLSIDYHGDEQPAGVKTTPESRLEMQVHCMLTRYFRGEAVDFDRLPVAYPEKPVTIGAVMRALREIPTGEVRSYQWMAEQLGNVNLTRAVGGALGRNRVPIVVPCHRIIAKDGGLGGFMRNHPEGSRIKRFLLGLEGVQLSGRSGGDGQMSLAGLEKTLPPDGPEKEARVPAKMTS